MFINPELSKITKTPLAVSGLILEITKDYFRNNCEQFAYSDDPVATRLIVDLHKNWNPHNCENYPGVYLKRQQWLYRKEGRVIGDYKQFTLPEDGMGYEFFVPITTSYSVICVGKQQGEIEILLDNLGTFYLVYNEPIRHHLDFCGFTVNGISPIDMLKEEKSYWVGQIDLEVDFDFTWKLTLEKPLLERMSINNTP
jgi:hypothetical protein